MNGTTGLCTPASHQMHMLWTWSQRFIMSKTLTFCSALQHCRQQRLQKHWNCHLVIIIIYFKVWNIWAILRVDQDLLQRAERYQHNSTSPQTWLEGDNCPTPHDVPSQGVSSFYCLATPNRAPSKKKKQHYIHCLPELMTSLTRAKSGKFWKIQVARCGSNHDGLESVPTIDEWGFVWYNELCDTLVISTVFCFSHRNKQPYHPVRMNGSCRLDDRHDHHTMPLYQGVTTYSTSDQPPTSAGHQRVAPR